MKAIRCDINHTGTTQQKECTSDRYFPGNLLERPWCAADRAPKLDTESAHNDRAATLERQAEDAAACTLQVPKDGTVTKSKTHSCFGLVRGICPGQDFCFLSADDLGTP